MNSKDKPDTIRMVATVSIPDGKTVEEVNAAGDAASAARAADRAKKENK
jgi:hypothetical protein